MTGFDKGANGEKQGCGPGSTATRVDGTTDA